jgi:hypothetical protein
MSQFEKPMNQPQKKVEPRVFPEVKAENLGKEIELELNMEQANFELGRDVAAAVSQFSNSPETLAKAMTMINAKYGEQFVQFQRDELKILLEKMSPDERKKFLDAQKKKRPYQIKPEDLPSKDELEAMGVKVM